MDDNYTSEEDFAFAVIELFHQVTSSEFDGQLIECPHCLTGIPQKEWLESQFELDEVPAVKCPECEYIYAIDFSHE